MRSPRRWTAAWLVSFLAASSLARGSSDPPVKLVTEIQPGPYFVGQAVTLGVGAISEGERPRIVPPKPEGAELFVASGTRFRQLAGSSFGDVLNSRHLFVSTFRLVPRRPGELVVPPFRAEAPGGRALSKPLSIRVAPLPIEGRPAGFLGGVGPIEPEAMVEPAGVVLGGSAEYRLRLVGEGALASREPPVISTLGDRPVRLEFQGTEAVQEPPSRVFRYVVRPERVGEVVIPAVPVSTFDPGTRRYLTKRSKSVRLRIENVPTYAPRPKTSISTDSTRRGWALTATIIALTIASSGLAIILLARALRSRAKTPQPTLSDFAARCESASTLDELVGEIQAGLIEFRSSRESGRVGEVTPAEFSEALKSLTADPELTSRVRSFLERVDRARFAETSAPADVDSLKLEAAGVFRELDKMSRSHRGC